MKPAFIITFLVAVLVAGCPADGDEDRPWPVNLPENPEDGYHFDGMADPFYEGWYYKVSLPADDESYFFIYTVVNPAPQTTYPPEAFLYCGRASTLETVFHSYPVDAFSAARRHRDARVGDIARATALRFAGEVDDDLHRCAWDIDLTGGVAWPETMGWLTGSAGLETYWTVGSITASASGWVEFDGKRVRFEDQKGYCDHNWGIAFPRSWIWMQANSFSDPGVALAAAGGTVDMGGSEIEAFMIGLLIDSNIVTFRSQDLDSVTSEAEKGSWHLVGERETERITITAHCDPAGMFHLLAPTREGTQARAWESLFGTVDVLLDRRESAGDDWKVVFQETSGYAGVEIGD